VIVSQSGLFELAVHAQVAPAVTATDPLPPVAEIVWLVGAMPNVHGAACPTVSVWPPMVTVPVRAAPGLAAAVTRTVPLPVPDDPAVTVIQSVLFEVAVQAQPAVVVTFVVASPPAAGMSTDVGERANAHGAAPCVTVKVRPAMLAVPVRAAPGLPATLSVTDPAPAPDAPEAIVIHEALDAAVHAHEAAAETVTAVVPPAAASVALDGSIV
jgi:hypothetical protein